VKISHEDTAEITVLTDVAIATIFGFLYMRAHWRHLANTTEPSMCERCRLIISNYCYY